jgi:hypothetical protein
VRRKPEDRGAETVPEGEAYMTAKRCTPKIEGIIIPSNWDEDGNIKGVSLHTSDEKEYRVEHGGVGRELLAHIHQKVEASGKIRERLDGRLYINVHSFQSLGQLPVENAPET